MPAPACFERILVPLDGSERAERAVEYAAGLAAPMRMPMRLLRVTPDDGDDARRYLEAVAARAGMATESVVRRGEAAHEILAEERAGDLVVMVTHGATGLERFWLGSVADRVVRYGRAPVMLVRAFHPIPRTFSPIVVPLDGSPAAETILPCVTEIAGALGASARLVRVVHAHLFDAVAYPPEIVGMALEWEHGESTRYLAAVAARLQGAGVRAESSVLDGEPSQAIIRAAEGAGLVAMTTRGHSGFSRAVLGSVAGRVAEHAAVPVLLVRV